ncbi:MAG TPA: hypothetical protein VME70_03955 [Mycobacteriales bacterium]|nr:hypothetical protein [Mycobacteriales bacterium]
MSHFGLCGRCTPRWSLVTAHADFGTALTAGLLAFNAIVSVGPPFACSASSFGLAPTLSVGRFV